MAKGCVVFGNQAYLCLVPYREQAPSGRHALFPGRVFQVILSYLIIQVESLIVERKPCDFIPLIEVSPDLL